MSGVNGKAQKIDRILARITELGNSLKLAMQTNARLEAENARLRKYLGSELFKRRQLIAGTASLNDVNDARIPTLEPAWSNRSNPLPHTDTETV